MCDLPAEGGRVLSSGAVMPSGAALSHMSVMNFNTRRENKAPNHRETETQRERELDLSLISNKAEI